MRRQLAIVLAVLLLGSACQEDRRSIRVGSKDFTEAFILGEMYALLLEDAGMPVDRRLNLGGTPVAHEGLLAGEIDVYPEYTGTGLVTVLKLPASSDREAVYETVAREYKSRYNLIWLTPAPMNNAQALAMTRARSSELGIRTISDMVARADSLKMIGPPEFEGREDGLPGLKRVYGDFTLQKYVAVDPGLKYQGLTSAQADVAVAFGTDGEIAALDLILLEDDKHLFPPYQVAPVVRAQAIERFPELGGVLNPLAPKLTDEVMRRLNNEVSGKKREPADVAREFLVQQGLIR
jgi:osmoprotectant transport system substrate-binding protein